MFLVHRNNAICTSDLGHRKMNLATDEELYPGYRLQLLRHGIEHLCELVKVGLGLELHRQVRSL
jgi:hypothetical protein